MTTIKSAVFSIKKHNDPLIVFTFEDVATPEFQELNKVLKGDLNVLQKQTFFKAKKQSTLLLRPLNLPCKAVLLIGLGKYKECSLDVLRRSAGIAAKALAKNKIKSASFCVPHIQSHTLAESALATAEGALLANYAFDMFKSKKAELVEAMTFATLSDKELKSIRAAIKVASSIKDAVFATRDLQNMPASKMGPTEFANAARKMARQKKLQCTIWGKNDIVKRKMGGVLAVNQGSNRDPKFIIIKYKASRSKKHVCLVGKGVTFDSGGLQIKPDPAMREMKMDMSGAAGVIGVMQAIADLKPAVNITAITALTDNMVGKTPYMPGDVVQTMSGKTIEVLHTDAEGRVTLADSLYYASTLKPDAIIDVATLTGACMVALGDHASGVFGNNQQLIDKLIAAGEETGERLWQLPLWEEYSEDVKGDIADVRNIGAQERYAGASTAAAFLQEFIGEAIWAHIDLSAAILNREKPYKPKGGSGEGVRLLVKTLMEW